MTAEKQEPSSFARQARARIGTTLNAKYRLDRLIGAGGMASVYAATHRNGSQVAVKMLHGPLSVDADIRRRFLREGYVANKVNHPGSVKIIDDDEAEDGSAFLVMELLLGESLDARWERRGKKLVVGEVMAMAHQLLDTLGAAHSSGIVHRDIKPANLFLTRRGELKVLDFGIARLLEATHGQAHTHTGRAVGTPAFMPPEQALGKSREIDGQTDLWAVGATMFTLLSGRDVHEAENVSEQLVFAATRPARSLASIAPALPAPVIAVIDRAVAFEKGARWAHAAAMQRAVDDAYAEAFGRPIEAALEELEAESDLGPVRSDSPGAFAPTVRSTFPGPDRAQGADSGTMPSTELRHSELRTGHPTTGGGAFSIEGSGSTRGTLASASGTRRRGLSVAIASAAILAAASLVGTRFLGAPAAGPARAEPAPAYAPAGTDDLAPAAPVAIASPASGGVSPEQPATPPAAVAPPAAAEPARADVPAPAVKAAKPATEPLAVSPPGAAAPAKADPRAPEQPKTVAPGARPAAARHTPEPSASAAAGQGGIVETPPY